MRKKIFFILYCIGLLLFTSLIYFQKVLPNNLKFLIKPINTTPWPKPLFESELIPEPVKLLSAHSATLTTLANGDLLALWFAGSHEGKVDVKIWQSIYTHGKWQMAHAVISPEYLQKSLSIYIRKVGNPVVYRAANGQLHLFVVSVAIGGWSGSHLNHFISNDDGRTWKTVGRLILSPLFNLSTLVRTSPVTLVDGGFYLPVYNEFIGTYPELLQFDHQGKFVRQIRLNDNGFLLQPAIVPISESHGMDFLRNKTRVNDILYKQDTYDGGATWSSPVATNLLNHDSSIAVINTGKTLLMVHNVYARDKLALAISKDGVTWRDIVYLENENGEEFSYPAIMLNKDRVDILYTWKRKQIKHVRFNLAWLMELAK